MFCRTDGFQVANQQVSYYYFCSNVLERAVVMFAYARGASTGNEVLLGNPSANAAQALHMSMMQNCFLEDE